MSRDIPEGIKRAVRQRDRFGCVICGLPVYDYEHFIEYSECGEHTVDNIYLACDRHHRGKGKLLSLSYIQKCREAPFHATHERTAQETMHFSSGDFRIRMGNNYLTVSNHKKAASALTVHGQSLLSFRVNDDGMLELSLKLFDEKDNLLLNIAENEVDLSTSHNWDCTWEGNAIVVRRALGQISLRVSYNVDDRIVWVESAELRHMGEMIDVASSTVSVRGNLIDECEGIDSDILLCVGEPPMGASCAHVVY